MSASRAEQTAGAQVLELAFLLIFASMVADRVGSAWVLLVKARLSAWEVWANLWEIYDW